MRLFLIFFLLCVSQYSLAQVRVVSLYEKEALVTGRFLPFKIYVNEAVQNIEKVSLSGGCESMKDPSRSSVFLIYCGEEAMVSGMVELTNGLQVTLEPLDVRSVSVLEIDEPTLPDPNPGPSLSGQELFETNCSSCHFATPIRTPIDSVGIVDALGRGAMKARSLDLLIGVDEDKVNALVEYINGR